MIGNLTSIDAADAIVARLISRAERRSKRKWHMRRRPAKNDTRISPGARKALWETACAIETMRDSVATDDRDCG